MFWVCFARTKTRVLIRGGVCTCCACTRGLCWRHCVCVQWGTRACGTHGSAPLAALEYVLEADKERHPPRVRFLGTHSATYRGVFPMPETRCESKELLLLVSVHVHTRVHGSAPQAALRASLEPGDEERTG